MVLHKYQLCKLVTITLHQSTIFTKAGSVGWFFKKSPFKKYIQSYLNFSVTILNTTHSTVTIQNLVTIFAS
jgi:hypothetical protein